MLKGVYNKYKKMVIYGSILLLITFLFNILLYEQAHKTLYLLSATCGFSSFIILRSNNITIEKIGFGMTRKEIEKIFLQELVYILIYSFILMALDALFILIICGKINASIFRVIEYFLVSLFLSLFMAFIRNNIRNKQKTVLIIALTVLLLVIIFAIKNLIIVNLLLIAIIIALYFINRHIFYNEDITSFSQKNNE